MNGYRQLYFMKRYIFNSKYKKYFKSKTKGIAHEEFGLSILEKRFLKAKNKMYLKDIFPFSSFKLLSPKQHHRKYLIKKYI